jgi:hypothetical protein
LIPVKKDGGTDIFPHFSLGGPIIKNRAWFFGSYAPQILKTYRTIEYTSNDPRNRSIVAAETYRQTQRNEYAFGRVDLQITDALRATGSYLWNPIDQRGVLPATTTKMDTVQNATTGLYTATLPQITFPVRGVVRGPALLENQGGRQSSNNTTGSIVWTPTEKLVLTARGGYSFLNEKLGNYGVPAVTGQLRQIVQATGFAAPANFGLPEPRTSRVSRTRCLTFRDVERLMPMPATSLATSVDVTHSRAESSSMASAMTF